jgi:hypothetical protein
MECRSQARPSICTPHALPIGVDNSVGEYQSDAGAVDQAMHGHRYDRAWHRGAAPSRRWISLILLRGRPPWFLHSGSPIGVHDAEEPPQDKERRYAHPHPAAVAHSVAAFVEDALRTASRVRVTSDPHVVDLHYHQILTDPIGAVEAVYAAAGLHPYRRSATPDDHTASTTTPPRTSTSTSPPCATGSSSTTTASAYAKNPSGTAHSLGPANGNRARRADPPTGPRPPTPLWRRWAPSRHDHADARRSAR